jgi:uncharacterized protein
MNILITGATGLVGRAVGKRLVENGHSVVAVSRDSIKAPTIVAFPATHITWDQLNQLQVPIDVVINLAGENIASGLWTEDKKQKILSSRTESVRHLKSFFSKNGSWPNLWLNASAVGWYGSKAETILREDFEKDNCAAESFLQAVCWQWEDSLRGIPDSVRTVAMRMGLVLDQTDGFFSRILPVAKVGLFGRLGSGEQWLSWIHIEDLVSAVFKIFDDRSIKGPVNMVSPCPIKQKTLVKVCNNKLGTWPGPPVPAMLLKIGGEFSHLFLDSQRAHPGQLERSGFQFKFGTIKAALDSLIDEPMPIRALSIQGPAGLSGGLFSIYEEQFVDRPMAEVFPFFCTEKNLETLTPPELNFHVVGKSTASIEEGTLIDYKLKIHGFPMRWRTKIEKWVPNQYFVDTQLVGPYKIWHHIHAFFPLGTGVLMIDFVRFKLPLWPLSVVALPFVKLDVQRIFKFRRSVIARLFAKNKN